MFLSFSFVMSTLFRCFCLIPLLCLRYFLSYFLLLSRSLAPLVPMFPLCDAQLLPSLFLCFLSFYLVFLCFVHAFLSFCHVFLAFVLFLFSGSLYFLSSFALLTRASSCPLL
jgi:hypothetical protein